MSEQDRLLSAQEVATRLQASVYTVRRWIQAGKLRAVMPGGTRLGYRIAESELTRFLQANQSGSPDGE